MSPPAPFRDHDRWLEYNDYLVGGLQLAVFAIMLMVGGFWHMTSGLVVETATTDSGAAGFAIVEVTNALFEGMAVFVVGSLLGHVAWELLEKAHRKREVAKRRGMASVMITTMLATAITQAITGGDGVSEE